MGTGSSRSLGSGVTVSPLPEFLLWAQKEQGKWGCTVGQRSSKQPSRGAGVSPIKSLGGTPGPRLGPLQPFCVCVSPHLPGPLIRSSFN